MNRTVHFQDRNYVESSSTAKIDPKTTTALDQQSLADLAMLNNMVASKLGEKDRRVNRFADKAAAVRRTWKILCDYQAQSTPLAAKSPKATRIMRFNFVPNSGMSTAEIKNKNTLRGRVAEILMDGATFAQVEEVVRQFDRDRGVPHKNVTRRAYEVIRILHYYLGFGVKHNIETGIISLYTSK